MTQFIDIKTRYSFLAIPDKIKKELAVIKIDLDEYVKEIVKYKNNRPYNQFYYDYDLELDFSENPKIPFDIDDRWYYYKAYHYLKIGLFLKKDAPPFKISLSHLSPEILFELYQLDEKERKFVLKQAVGRIFEDINFDMYHDSISVNLEVVLVK